MTSASSMAYRFGGEAQTVMERYQRAQFAFRVAVEQHFERAASAVAGALPRSFFDVWNKMGVQREAGPAKRHERDPAGQLGAGESMPAAAHEASRMSSWRSSKATRRFRFDNSKAIEPPMMPPPTITTSKVFMRISYQQKREE